MNLYGKAKRVYRATFPRPLQRALLSRRNPLRPAILAFKAALEGSATYDEIYDDAYFVRAADSKRRAANRMAASIVRDTSPTSIVDVGCGGGYLLDAFRAHGVSGLGLERARSALALCRDAGLRVQEFDLERDVFRGERFDIAASTEVAEHLPAHAAGGLVDLLVALAPFVVFTAAPPGQQGAKHVNEQPRDYWIERFAARGFALHEDYVRKWRDEWQRADVPAFYWRNLMVFSRRRPPQNDDGPGAVNLA
jgi:SAM-dependent methyltransferase